MACLLVVNLWVDAVMPKTMFVPVKPGPSRAFVVAVIGKLVWDAFWLLLDVCLALGIPMAAWFVIGMWHVTKPSLLPAVVAVLVLLLCHQTWLVKCCLCTVLVMAFVGQCAPHVLFFIAVAAEYAVAAVFLYVTGVACARVIWTVTRGELCCLR